MCTKLLYDSIHGIPPNVLKLKLLTKHTTSLLAILVLESFLTEWLIEFCFATGSRSRRKLQLQDEGRLPGADGQENHRSSERPFHG